MEKIKKNLNKIIIGIVLVFLVTFIYNYVNKEETEDVVEVVIGGKNEIARKILETLSELEKINPDYGFFTETLSNSGNTVSFFQLIDFSEKELPEKDYGKNNPFLENSSVFTVAEQITTPAPEALVVEEVVIPETEKVEEVFESESEVE